MNEEEDFIPGIYNYCDRWCDRCPHTLKCQLFQDIDDLEIEEMTLNVHSDRENEEFWTQLEKKISIMENTLEDPDEFESEFDMDMDDDEMDEILEEHERIHHEAENSRLGILCKEYLDVLQPFQNYFKTESEIPENMKDFVDVILWYYYFIPPKFYRALSGKIEGDEDLFEETGEPKDSEASAKIAMIAVNRSRQAILALWDLLKETELHETMIRGIALLDKIKREALREFPNAMNVKRPGLDD